VPSSFQRTGIGFSWGERERERERERGTEGREVGFGGANMGTLPLRLHGTQDRNLPSIRWASYVGFLKPKGPKFCIGLH
jgi:hypothetical protein